jgi:hypothetical protein
MTMTLYAGEPAEYSGSAAPARERDEGSEDYASYAMLQLYRTNLEVRLQCIDQSTLSEHQRQVAASVAQSLRALPWGGSADHRPEWDEVYRLERLIAVLFNGAELRQENLRRLNDLADAKAPEAERLRQEYAALTGAGRDGQAPAVSDGVLRNFLLGSIEALQRVALRRSLAQPLRQAATKKILVCLVVTFGLLLLPCVLLSLDFSPYPNHALNPAWSHFGLYTALLSGALGAFFSRLMILQRDWPTMALEELCCHAEWTYSLLRAGVGMCGAVILYYLFQAGLIDSSLFPHVDKVGLRVVPVQPPAVHMAFTVPSKDLALLMVWCLVGGFSDVLIPGLLAKTERQFGQGEAAAKAR